MTARDDWSNRGPTSETLRAVVASWEEFIAGAIADERCNACGAPRREWGPTCWRMTTGDMTHYHSPEWWSRGSARFQLLERWL